MNQAIKALWDQGNLQTINIKGSRMGLAAKLTFDMLKIKQSRASEGSNEVIKHTFCQSKILMPAADASTGNI